MQRLIELNVDKVKIADALKSEIKPLIICIGRLLWSRPILVFDVFKFLKALPMNIFDDVVTGINEKKVEFIKQFLMYIKAGKIQNSEILSIIEVLNQVSINWIELDSIKKSIKFEIHEQLNEDNNDILAKATNQFDSYNPIGAISIIAKNKLTVNNYPELQEWLSSKKDVIIKGILRCIMDANPSDSNSLLKMIVHQLISTEINWPELNILKRSLEGLK